MSDSEGDSVHYVGSSDDEYAFVCDSDNSMYLTVRKMPQPPAKDRSGAFGIPCPDGMQPRPLS